MQQVSCESEECHSQVYLYTDNSQIISLNSRPIYVIASSTSPSASHPLSSYLLRESDCYKPIPIPLVNKGAGSDLISPNPTPSSDKLSLNQTCVLSPSCGKANLLTLGCDKGKCSVYCSCQARSTSSSCSKDLNSLTDFRERFLKTD